MANTQITLSFDTIYEYREFMSKIDKAEAYADTLRAVDDALRELYKYSQSETTSEAASEVRELLYAHLSSRGLDLYE